MKDIAGSIPILGGPARVHRSRQFATAAVCHHAAVLPTQNIGFRAREAVLHKGVVSALGNEEFVSVEAIAKGFLLDEIERGGGVNELFVAN